MKKELLNLANEDFESAIVLYEAKKYSIALYHYHQCVEKVMKQVAMNKGMTEQTVRKEIKHDPIIGFKIIILDFLNNPDSLLPKEYAHLFTNIDQIINEDSEDDFISLLIEMVIDIMDESHSKQISVSMNQARNHFQDSGLDQDLSPVQVDIKKFAITELENDPEYYILAIKITYILLVNSSICRRYKPDEFRYSSVKYGNPIEYFNNNHILVRNLPTLLESMKFVLSIL